MQKIWTTVASFSHPIEAHLACNRLEEAGITAKLADEHLVSTDWLYAQAVGGVRVQVDEIDATRAKKLLRELPEDEEIDWGEVNPAWAEDEREEAGPGVGCPACRCADISYEPFSRRLVFLSILLLGIPLPLMSRTWRCDRCGHEWKNGLFKRP
jgi:hypothetical protein